MTDKLMTEEDQEFLYLSINQAEFLRDKLNEALDSIRFYQAVGERIDSLVVQYPKEIKSE